MFLALKEIQYSKLRYALVVGLLFFVSLLVFFLTGLAYGLAKSNRSAIDEWQADEIILSDGVSNQLRMSQFPLDDWDEISSDEKAPIGVQDALFENPNDGEDEAIQGQLFGIELDSFLKPEIVDGEDIDGENEVIVDTTLLEKNNLSIGDKLKFNDSDDELTIVGVTEGHQLSVQPGIYLSLDDYANLEMTPGSEDTPIISAGIIRGEASVDEDEFDQSAIDDFIQDLPGYAAQNLTFLLMIGFLVIISAIILGIFIYILTLQKVSTFGVMKAQGIGDRYIITSVVAQTFILSIIGIAGGLIVTGLVSFGLPADVPYENNWPFYAGISALMVVVSVLGGLFSARTITKIDPLEAIG